MTGASGNVGTGVLRRLAAHHPEVEVVGVCRRPPPEVHPYDRVRWHAIDVGSATVPTLLAEAFRSATAVVHLAWAIQSVRQEDVLYRSNVEGTRAVPRAAQAAGVDHVVYSSSLGVYVPGATRPVDEQWTDSGQRSSVYSRHKVSVERMLDRFERDNPRVAVARFRPTLVVQRTAATEMKELFLHPAVPGPLIEVPRRGLLPALPLPRGLALQFVHADDVGDAVVAMLRERSHGVYNLAADTLDASALAATVGTRPMAVSQGAMRTAVGALFAARVLRMSSGWFDVALNTPLMSTDKARKDPGWEPRYGSAAGVRELLDGLAEGAVGASPAMGG